MVEADEDRGFGVVADLLCGIGFLPACATEHGGPRRHCVGHRPSDVGGLGTHPEARLRFVLRNPADSAIDVLGASWLDQTARTPVCVLLLRGPVIGGMSIPAVSISSVVALYTLSNTVLRTPRRTSEAIKVSRTSICGSYRSS